MKSLSTRSRLVLLVVLAALPMVAVTIYGSWDERVRAAATAHEDMLRLVKVSAQRQAQVVEGAKHTLAAISLIPSALLDDPARCNEYLAKLLEEGSGIYHSMGIYRADGLLVCNALPWQGKVYSPDRSYVQLPLSSGKFSIGEYQVGRITKKPGINFGYPLKDSSGKISGVAFLALDLANFNRLATTIPMPEQGIVSMIDRNGILLVRHPEATGRVGEKLSLPRVLETILAGRSGIFEAPGNDGQARLFAYETVAENPDGSVPIRIIISIPLQVIYADANRSLVRDLALILAATLLLLVGAWYGAEFFLLRRITTLLSTANRVRSGDLTARTGMRHDNDELNQLGQAVDEMAQALGDRDAELKRVLEDLKEQAVTDPLTGLLNRRYLREYLPRELSRAERNGTSLAVIMLDLDHFKRVNDTFGHDGGDLVLRELGALLRKNIRAGDVACRIGGEEFMLVLPATQLEGARLRAEAIRAAVRNLDLNHAGKPLGVITASLGVAIYPVHGSNADTLQRAADEALYEAKGAGRDRVVVYEQK